MTTILAFIVVIGVLVLVHELGHYLIARYYGVRVLTFSVGFGPKLLTIRRGGTAYCVGAIPLGGYVQMAGTDLKGGAERRPDEFLSKTRWQRFMILAAGPLMNVAFAVIVAVGALLYGMEVPAYRSASPVVGDVVPGSAADRAGIVPGDRVLAVSGRPVGTWAAAESAIAAQPEGDLELTVLRSGQVISLAMSATPGATGRLAGLRPDMNPVVRAVTPGSLADRAGLEVGDIVLAIDGRPVRDVSVAAPSSWHPGQAVAISVRRGDRERQLSVTVDGVDEGRTLGAALGVPTTRLRTGVLDAVVLGISAIAATSGIILDTIAGLATGSIPLGQLLGPVGMAQMAGQSARAGWMELLGVMAFISLNLGIFNLLPIPLLDGGHMTMLAVEGARGADLNAAARRMLLRGGLAVMLVLVLAAVYNDLGRLGWLPRM